MTKNIFSHLLNNSKSLLDSMQNKLGGNLKLPPNFSYTVIFCFLLLVSGCGSDYIFKKEIEIPDQGWYYNNILAFDFEINDNSKKYNLLLDVKHAGDYGFQNLYVQFHTTYPSGEKKDQVLSLELAGKSGVWNGHCSGNTCRVEIPLQVNATFEETGRHTLSIEQFMRKDPLLGIKGMTLKIAENKN